MVLFIFCFAGVIKCCGGAGKVHPKGGETSSIVRHSETRISMVNAVVEDFCDLARLIRSLQRLEGQPECFGTGQPSCEGTCCAWREYCLKAEGGTVPHHEKEVR